MKNLPSIRFCSVWIFLPQASPRETRNLKKTVSLTISNTKVKNVQVQKNIAYGKRSVAG